MLERILFGSVDTVLAFCQGILGSNLALEDIMKKWRGRNHEEINGGEDITKKWRTILVSNKLG